MARTAMSAGSFIASLVSSLAWPAVVVTILVIFHRQFGTMLERLARVRLGAGAVEGDADWNQTEAVVRRSLTAARRPAGEPSTAGSPGSPAGGLPRASALRPGAPARPGAGAVGGDVERPPRALVEDRWQALSDELRGVIRPGGSLSEGQLAAADFDQLMEAALRAGLLDAATVRSLDGLRHLRNLARADPSLAHRQAQEFAVLADAASYGMRRDSGSVWPSA